MTDFLKVVKNASNTLDLKGLNLWPIFVDLFENVHDKRDRNYYTGSIVFKSGPLVESAH